MPIEPMEPEDRVSLTESILGMAMAVIIAPGLVWWIGKIFELITGERPW